MNYVILYSNSCTVTAAVNSDYFFQMFENFVTNYFSSEKCVSASSFELRRDCTRGLLRLVAECKRSTNTSKYEIAEKNNKMVRKNDEATIIDTLIAALRCFDIFVCIFSPVFGEQG